MSVSFSSSNTSSAPALSVYYMVLNCKNFTDGEIQFIPFIAINILFLLPLYIIILYLLVRQWRQQQKCSTALSHSDHFTCHMVLMELIGVIGSIAFFCGIHIDLSQSKAVGTFLLFIGLNGQAFLHFLTCLERYLAVVHPVTYRSLRNSKGIQIRNVTIGISWLLSFAIQGFLFLENLSLYKIVGALYLVLSIANVSFCSFSVLLVLIHSGPGKGGGKKKKIDKTKQRAFFTITAILVVLSIKFIGFLISNGTITSKQKAQNTVCAVMGTALWISLPSSLVLPLLYLHRAGKLGCMNNRETESIHD